MTSTPTSQNHHTAPAASTLNLLIDGNEVTLTGTVKGNPTHQALTPRPWVWSRRAAAYVLPRNLLPRTRHDHIQQLRRAAEAAHVTLEVEDTQREMTETERRQDRDERLAVRAERHSTSAQTAAARAQVAEEASARITYPLGQPILIGHHSEGRHRRDLARKDRYERTAITQTRHAHERERLARQLREHLEKGENPVTIRQRIERTEATLRRLGRQLNRQPNDGMTWAEIQRLTQALTLDQDAITHLEAQGLTTTYSRENVQPGDQVRIGGHWWPVTKTNAATLTVDTSPLTGRPTSKKTPYAKVTDHRPGTPPHQQ